MNRRYPGGALVTAACVLLPSAVHADAGGREPSGALPGRAWWGTEICTCRRAIGREDGSRLEMQSVRRGESAGTRVVETLRLDAPGRGSLTDVSSILSKSISRPCAVMRALPPFQTNSWKLTRS